MRFVLANTPHLTTYAAFPVFPKGGVRLLLYFNT